jgi:hypothetical protein
MRLTSVFLGFSLVAAPDPAFAALEPLLFSGQPGITVDANGNGQVDAGDGMITARYDPDVDVIVFDIDANFGGGHVIYQITTEFNTQVLKEVAQYPLTGPAVVTNSRPASEFFTIFLDTIDFTPGAEKASLLEELQGGK